MRRYINGRSLGLPELKSDDGGSYGEQEEENGAVENGKEIHPKKDGAQGRGAQEKVSGAGHWKGNQPQIRDTQGRRSS